MYAPCVSKFLGPFLKAGNMRTDANFLKISFET